MPETRRRQTTRSVKAPRARSPGDTGGQQPRGIDAASLATNRMIVEFMKASARVEQYLQEKRPLNDLQYGSIATTVDGLRTFLMTWHTHFRMVK